jgi:hypothetical protein
MYVAWVGYDKVETGVHRYIGKYALLYWGGAGVLYRGRESGEIRITIKKKVEKNINLILSGK